MKIQPLIQEGNPSILAFKSPFEAPSAEIMRMQTHLEINLKNIVSWLIEDGLRFCVREKYSD